MKCYNCPHLPHKGLCNRPTCPHEFNDEICKCSPCLCFTAEATEQVERRKKERNQCDGCQAGMFLYGGSHYPKGPDYLGYQNSFGCTKDRYR